MEGAVNAWTSMSYGEGFIFTLWLIGLYYLKLRMDAYFAGKRMNFWSKGIKDAVIEALNQYYETGTYGEKQ